MTVRTVLIMSMPLVAAYLFGNYLLNVKRDDDKTMVRVHLGIGLAGFALLYLVLFQVLLYI